MRHTLEAKIVKQIAAANLMGKGQRKTQQLIKNRYEREMEKMGFDAMTIYRGYNDCCDMADLENMSEAA